MSPRQPKQARPAISQAEAIRLLTAYHESGFPLNGEKIRNENPALYRAVIVNWGSWLGALESLGLPAVRRHKWTKEKVLAEIRKLIDEGRPVTTMELVKENTGLIYQFYKHFKSFKELPHALGITYNRSLSREELMDRLREQSRMPGGLSIAELKKAKLNSPILRHFGSRKKALKALDPEGPEIFRTRLFPKPSKWSPAKILDSMRGLKNERGTFMGANIAKSHPSLYKSAINYFGSWKMACQKAESSETHCFVETGETHWTKQRLLGWMSSLLVQYGDPGSIPASEKKELEIPCVTHFGSLRKGFLRAHQERKKRFFNSMGPKP